MELVPELHVVFPLRTGMGTQFTEGAARALRRAAQLAEEQRVAEIEPVHLLWALRLEESRAAEILDRHALSHEALERRFPLQRSGAAEGGELGRTAVEGEALRRAIGEARSHAGLAGRHAEVGSEHLLYGLSSIESAVAPLLGAHGLNREEVDRQVRAQSDATDEPIDVDVRLSSTGRPPDEQTETFRILDAAANRAREGLRVVEDYVRFTLDDAYLTRLLKECRHELTESLRAAGARGWIAARDTEADVGTDLSTAAERLRRSPVDVLHANLKRVQEATRTLEEFGKMLPAEFADRVGRLRYRLYTVEKALLLTEASRERLQGRDLYLLLTESLCTGSVENVVQGALRAGVGIIQIREKSLSDRQLLEHARRVRRWTRDAGALLIMNDRPDLAVLCDADGVHVGQEELAVRDARRIVGPDRLVGVSTHSIAQAREAVLGGADYVGVGPVFPSGTKSFAELAGLDFVREAAAEITLPWFAIGGIDTSNVSAVWDAGARRIAVSSVLCAADDPARVARELLNAIRA